MVTWKFMAAAVVGLSVLSLGAAPTAVAPPTVATRPAAPASTRPAEPADQPIARGTATSGWMRQHNGYVEKAKAGNIDLYMLGDSITDFWGNQPRFRANWDKNLGGWKPGDFGISGDRTQHVLWRITHGELDGVKPRVVVLMIGTNNLPPNPAITPNTPEETARGIKAIVEVLKEKQPQAKILLLAVFPRADARAGTDIMEKIDKVNEIIATYDDGKQVKFLNINKAFLNAEGKLTTAIMPDLLHPGERGYQLWADAIRPQLTEWLGAPAPLEASGAATQPR
jgi:lysophospholipase L1-like esterase